MLGTRNGPGETLVQISDGETVDVLDPFATGVSPSDEFSAIDLTVRFDENDTGGLQARVGASTASTFAVISRAGPAAAAPTAIAPDASGALFRDTLFLSDGAACDAQLTWALLLDRDRRRRSRSGERGGRNVLRKSAAGSNGAAEFAR